MKKSWILLTACAALLSGVEAIACTGLLVGKKASTDGSVMISYAADSHSLYGEMYRWPAATWPKGAMLEVKEWDTGKPLGKISICHLHGRHIRAAIFHILEFHNRFSFSVPVSGRVLIPIVRDFYEKTITPV